MKHHKRTIIFAAALVAASAIIYFVHFLVFHDAKYIFKYLLNHIAFVPMEVLLAVLIIERVLDRHEKHQMMQKLNMVIGTFFSELGTQLLGDLTRAVKQQDQLRETLAVKGAWKPADFKKASSAVAQIQCNVDLDKVDLHGLRRTLSDKRALLLTLLANPNLLEHERFTDLLWAVFHVVEELEARKSLDDMPAADRKHVAGDIARVYSHLTVEWLSYCAHLKTAYPYIFSIVVRTHPLQESPCATVTE